MKKELVLQTLRAAQDRWHLPADVIFHSDRGSQYTADDVMTQVSDYGWKQSFSYVGRPGDNAWSESFFYNRRRVQKRLGYQIPLNFLNAWQQLHLQSVA